MSSLVTPSKKEIIRTQIEQAWGLNPTFMRVRTHLPEIREIMKNGVWREVPVSIFHVIVAPVSCTRYRQDMICYCCANYSNPLTSPLKRIADCSTRTLWFGEGYENFPTEIVMNILGFIDFSPCAWETPGRTWSNDDPRKACYVCGYKKWVSVIKYSAIDGLGYYHCCPLSLRSYYCKCHCCQELNKQTLS